MVIYSRSQPAEEKAKKKEKYKEKNRGKTTCCKINFSKVTMQYIVSDTPVVPAACCKRWSSIVINKPIVSAL